MSEITIKIPDHLLNIARKMVVAGWFVDENELFLLSLRNYIRTHSEEIMTSFIEEDIHWGLSGNE